LLRFARGDPATRIIELWQATVLVSALASAGILLVVAVLLAPHFTSLPGPLLPHDTAPGSVATLGRSTGPYALYSFVAPIIVALGFVMTGAVIAWRQPTERGALVFSLVLVGFGDAFALGSLVSEPAHSSVLVLFFVNSGFVSLAIASYLFPDGRLVPGWTRWPSLVWLYVAVATSWFAGSPVDPNSWNGMLDGIFWLGITSTCLVALIYRYRRVSTPIQRQQTKWVAFGLSAFVLALIVYTASSPVPSHADPHRQLVLGLVLMTALLLIPLTVGLAMLRYRLWDVDALINRTLVYGVLSVLLAVIYIASVVGLQAFFRVVTGQASNVSIAVSTLVIAALFSPLRRWSQRAIDRRFYRRKYDAARTLASFSTHLRDVNDLDQLAADLAKVVEETMQPTYVSLWLR
jgi:hypothetical protein